MNKPFDPCLDCKHDKCEMCTDLEDMPSMTEVYVRVLKAQREGETFEQAENRLRRDDK